MAPTACSAHRAPVWTIAPTTTLFHRFGSSLSHEELALEDCIEEPIVFFFGKLQKRLRLEYAGIVDKDIEAPKFLLGQGRESICSRWIRNITCEETYLTRFRRYLRSNRK